METPSSTRRMTRSQTKLASANSNSNNNIPMSKKIEESEKGVTKSRQRNGKQQQQDRSALIDITNDSPIVGLAMGSLVTPSSAMSKKRLNMKGGKFGCGTPGSGEALLRGQVKTLLQKVEEEAEISKISLENRLPFNHLTGFVNSPMALLAPTPANTPQILNLSANGISQIDGGLASVTASPVEDKFIVSQMANKIIEGKKQEGVVESKDFVTRSLLFDFSEKSEDSSDCSSAITQINCSSSEQSKEKISSTTDDDDSSSTWSMQVNVSSTKDDDEDVLEEVVEEECYDYEEDEYDEGLVDELCEGIIKMNVNGMARFAGKHTRFVYKDDGEIEGHVECVDESEITPKGKHLRFHDDDEDED